ncbi:predicted protein [Naegleria gruberi]|uniref:Predicted protein n=1 Tax=Naegleria gruberi TaxID=5762 RepID=D2VNZ5_NAEGR|nr:uncharacterized protein NAEGRDRAFT_70674 [Naegleria gruberi]EFC41507.1 predicted protein [Naegleria gruberi]|eukprot:XP_002674251.1 predicted protein [Naegleria gruberi strain NEG-M]
MSEQSSSNSSSNQQVAATSSSADLLFVDPLQLKIKTFLEKAKTVTLLENLKSQRQFHNPEILNKIMKEFSLHDEYGTNTPSEIYTPISAEEYKEMSKKRQLDQEKQNFM